MVSVVLLNLYVAFAVAAGGVGADGVKQFALTKAAVQAQVAVTCPAPAMPAHHRRPMPPWGGPATHSAGKSWR